MFPGISSQWDTGWLNTSRERLIQDSDLYTKLRELACDVILLGHFCEVIGPVILYQYPNSTTVVNNGKKSSNVYIDFDYKRFIEKAFSADSQLDQSKRELLDRLLSVPDDISQCFALEERGERVELKISSDTVLLITEPDFSAIVCHLIHLINLLLIFF